MMSQKQQLAHSCKHVTGTLVKFFKGGPDLVHTCGPNTQPIWPVLNISVRACSPSRTAWVKWPGVADACLQPHAEQHASRQAATWFQSPHRVMHLLRWQVDAVINRDNSGGPVLDSFGRMVGLATATYSTYTTSVRPLHLQHLHHLGMAPPPTPPIPPR